MQRAAVLLLLVSLTFSHAQSKNHWGELIPPGKEVDYRYEATIDAGISLPDAYSSMFHLRGLLHVQAGQENDILLRLSGMNYTLDNGRRSEFPEKTPVRVSDTHLITLTEPFRIVYGDDGKFREIGVGENVPDYVLNIKKALASIFQVDWAGVRLNSVKGHSFTSHESGLHGIEENMYNVIADPKILRVEKMHYMKSSRHLYHQVVSNINLAYCDDKFEDPLSHDSQKIYIVDRTQNVLKKIENTGGIYYHPYQTVSPAYNIYTTQSLEMVSMHDIEATMLIEKEIKINSLQFIFPDINAPLEIVSDKQPLVTIAQTLLEDLLNFNETHKIDMLTPDVVREQLPHRLQNLLMHFDTSMLENLLKLLQGKDVKQTTLFHQMLPYVRTQTAMKFLIQLIKEKKMDDFSAIKALQIMPFFTVPNEKIITESEILLRLEGASPLVQNVAILSFATLLQRAQKGFLNHHTLVSDGIIEKYITLFVDKLKTSNTMDEKYLYFHALKNIKSPLVIKYLKEAITGDWLDDNNLRLKAMFALRPLMSENPSMLYELYWPILTDKSLPTDLRIMAFHTIMRLQPPLSWLINIYWFMQSETDIDVYQFYYTTLESLANTKNPCDRQNRLHAMQMMKYMRVPYRHSLTQYRKIDFNNPEINVGEYIEWFLIDTNDSLLFELAFGRNMMNLQLVPFTFYLRISGLHGKILNDVKLNLKKQMKLFNYEQLIQNLLNLPKTEGVHIEFVFMKHDQIILADSIQKTNYDMKRQLYMDLFKGHLHDAITLDIDLFYRITIPSDIGFPLMPTAQEPVIKQVSLDLQSDYSNNIFTLNLNGKMRERRFYINGLYIHNTIAHAWQGVAKTSMYDAVLPLNIDINLNPQQDMLKISWKRHKNQEENIWLKRSYVTHIVQNYDYMNPKSLKTFNPNTQTIVTVPTNKKYINNYTIAEVEDYDTGYVATIQVFDTEDTISLEKISELQVYALDTSSFIEHSIKYLQFNDDLLSQILRYSSLEYNLAMMHKYETRGVFIKYEPSKTNPLSSIDVSLRLSHELTKDIPSEIFPGMKINLKISCALKKEEDLVKRWDVNLNWELNNGHTQNSIKGQMTRTLPGQNNYKICVEGLETYSETGLVGNMNILMSSSPEGTCSTHETSIDITMKGERLPEQLKSRYNFPSCRQQVLFGVRDMPSYSCLTDRTSIRRYEVEITSKNLPQEFQNKIESFLEFLKVKYYEHYSQEISNESGKDTTKMLLTYPISNDILDMEMLTKGHRYKLLALPAVNFRKYGLFVPDNLYYGNVRRLVHSVGLVYTCLANTFDIMNANNTLLANAVMEEWVLLIGNTIENADLGVWIKRMDNKLALKIVQKMHILLVLPVGNTFTLTLDGKTIQNEPLFTNEWLVLMAEKNNLAILVKSCGTQIIYNTNEMLMEVPKKNMELVGKCL